MTMFDPTRLSVIAFAVIRYALLGTAIVLVLSVLRRVTADPGARHEYPEKPLLDGVSKFRLVTSAVLIAVWFGLFFYNETVYRPKTTLRPDNPALEQKLREIDSAPKPEPGPKPTPTPTWEEKADKNRRENEEARKAFDETAPDRK